MRDLGIGLARCPYSRAPKHNRVDTNVFNAGVAGLTPSAVDINGELPYDCPYTGGDVMAATARLEFRVTPTDRALIERAAQLTGEPVTAFARTAAEERAERVLREHEAITTVPAEFFDDLIAAFDEPAQVSPALAHAAARLGETIVRD